MGEPRFASEPGGGVWELAEGQVPAQLLDSFWESGNFSLIEEIEAV